MDKADCKNIYGTNIKVKPKYAFASRLVYNMKMEIKFCLTLNNHAYYTGTCWTDDWSYEGIETLKTEMFAKWIAEALTKESHQNLPNNGMTMPNITVVTMLFIHIENKGKEDIIQIPEAEFTKVNADPLYYVNNPPDDMSMSNCDRYCKMLAKELL